VEYDSKLEKEFAETLDGMENIKLFVKLPAWFRVKTPLGDYNPDWAIVKEDDRKVYLVRETKGTTDRQKLPPEERGKIKCGESHFKDCLKVNYKVVSSAAQID
jgi:type III restriction enzyme